jgi:hypothetical protein
MQLVGLVNVAILLASTVPSKATTRWSVSSAVPRAAPRQAALQLQADLKDAATKLEEVLKDVETNFGKARKELVAVKDHCQVEMGATSGRVTTQQSKIIALQETREVQLQKQAEAEATLQIMQSAMNEKVQSYQSTVALRAKEAISFYGWNNTNAEYSRVLEGTVDILEKKNLESGKGKSSNLGEVKGVLEGMRQDVKTKMQEQSTKHEGQDADFLTLVNSYRKSLADSQAAFTSKREQKDGFLVNALDAQEEGDTRQAVEKSNGMVLEILVHLCAEKSGKVPRTISSGDTQLDSVKGRVGDTSTTMKSMPDVAAAFLALQAHSGLRQAQFPLDGAKRPVADARAAARREEMKRMAAEIKTKQAATAPRTFLRHRATVRRKVITVAAPRKLWGLAANQSAGSSAAYNVTPVQVLHPALQGLASSAVAVGRQVSTVSSKAMPTNLNECVKEKQRIAADITLQRSNIQDAESKKKIAETRTASIDKCIKVANDGKKELSTAYNGFSKAWMPLMTLIGTDAYVKDMNSALKKLDSVDSDVKAYAGEGGAPAAASALPTALKGVRTSIETLRDDVQADLANLQTLFTGSLMVTYPKVGNDLSAKVDALEKEKAVVAKDLSDAEQALGAAQKKESQLKTEWDQVEDACKPLLKKG